MRDASRRHREIWLMLKNAYPTEPRGRVAHHLNTLVMMVCGLIGSGKSHLSAIAGQAPSQSKTESQIKQFSRWLANENIDAEVYYLPYRVKSHKGT